MTERGSAARRPGGTERDSQRSRVYAAESVVQRLHDRARATGPRSVELHGSTVTLPTERRFADVASMQRYLEQVLALAWVRERWPQRAAVAVHVVARRGQGRAEYLRATSTVAIPPHDRNHAWAMRELVLLHELAHHLAPDDVAAAHGPPFVERLLVLVEEIVGPETAFVLRATLLDSGVRS